MVLSDFLDITIKDYWSPPTSRIEDVGICFVCLLPICSFRVHLWLDKSYRGTNPLRRCETLRLLRREKEGISRREGHVDVCGGRTRNLRLQSSHKRPKICWYEEKAGVGSLNPPAGLASELLATGWEQQGRRGEKLCRQRLHQSASSSAGSPAV